MYPKNGILIDIELLLAQCHNWNDSMQTSCTMQYANIEYDIEKKFLRIQSNIKIRNICQISFFWCGQVSLEFRKKSNIFCQK